MSTPRHLFDRGGIASPEQGGPQYIGRGTPINPQYIGRGTPVEPQYIGLGDPTGYDRPHTNETLMPSGITPTSPRGGGTGNQAKISIALPANKLFESDNSQAPSYTPVGQGGQSIYANLPYPNVGLQAPGGGGMAPQGPMTPVGQAGPGMPPVAPQSPQDYYNQEAGMYANRFAGQGK